MTPCLRPASLSDLPLALYLSWFRIPGHATSEDRKLALFKMYTAEWRLRGFERSP